jgi:alpha-L-fucosidase 2
VAREHYGARGWVLHHNTDLWRGAAPINDANHGIWPTGGAWLAQHLWWHWEYGGDERFLRDEGYPLMRDAARFFVDYLVEDPRTGALVSGPSNSPENGGLVMGPTMDHQIVRALFANTIAASEVLGVDAGLRDTLRAMRARIAPNAIGRLGQLQEWLEDRDDPQNRHRHVSHLWGLHPGAEITRRGTPALFAAARRSLELRGDEGTGWSKAWKINFWARLHDGERAYRLVRSLVSPTRDLKTTTAATSWKNPNPSCSPRFRRRGPRGACAGCARAAASTSTSSGRTGASCARRCARDSGARPACDTATPSASCAPAAANASSSSHDGTGPLVPRPRRARGAARGCQSGAHCPARFVVMSTTPLAPRMP